MTRHDIYAGVQQRKRHGDAPGVRSPRKRRAGARRGSAPLAVLLSLVMALAFPARAQADGVLPSSGWQPFTWYSNSYGVEGTLYCVTNSASDFNSALFLIGRMSDYLQLSNEQLAKLSNEGSGGRFYELANKFVNGGEVDLVTGYPGIGAVDASAISVACGLYGAGNTWFAKVTQDELEGAYTDYMVIYNGGSLGGGGDVLDFDMKTYVVTGTTLTYALQFNTGDKTYYSSTRQYNNGDTDKRMRLPPTFTLAGIDTTLLKSFAVQQGANVSDFIYFAGYLSNVGGSPSFTLYLLPKDVDVGYTAQKWGTDTYDYRSISRYTYPSTSGYMYRVSVSGSGYTFDGTTLTLSGVTYGTPSRSSYSAGSSVTVDTTSGFQSGTGSGGGGGDNNWPGPTDEPEPGPPEPPREPDPIPRDPIDWPQPYNPTTPAPGPEPTPTTPVTNPTNTSPADYTPWFMAILSELRGIHTDVNAWLDAIFEGIVDYGAAICSHIDTASENIRSTLRFMTQWMDEQLDSSFYQLRHLLWECANYIADSLDYTFVGPDVNVPGYDDSSVLYWLKRIYYKLGSGNVNTRPVDPVGDHDNWWDWIVELIKNLILDLGMMGADFLSDMGDVLSEVMQKFPFSIPWDIAAYLTAFSTQPVTPVIVITMPAISGFLPQTQFTIDLHPYDDAMATVRAVEVIVFTFWLMWKCPILLDMMDTAKWGI